MWPAAATDRGLCVCSRLVLGILRHRVILRHPPPSGRVSWFELRWMMTRFLLFHHTQDITATRFTGTSCKLWRESRFDLRTPMSRCGSAGDTVGALGLPGLGVLLSERRGTNVDRRITDVLSVLSQAPTEVVAPGRRAWLALMKPPR